MLGDYVEIPDRPERIVSLSPAVTETLYLLGLEERIVGVSYFCNKPPKAAKKPRVGSYYNVNYKKLEELKPDLILTTTGAQRKTSLELAQRGYTVYPLPLPVSLYGILENIVSIGHVTGTTERARELSRRVAQSLEYVKGQLEGLKVYYEIWLGGPVTAGRFSYISDALSHIGLQNCFDSHKEPWVINPDPRKVIECGPDVILYELPPYSEQLKKKIWESLKERGLLDIDAAKNGIVFLPPDSLAHYGPSIAESLEDIVLVIRGKPPVHSRVERVRP
ncbi:MAG: ABC transporter substrate-binding protein [Desulfurococcales archaeon]|nr:ABC transporter substrate-binding protein [Desulfurococcales archaeon]